MVVYIINKMFVRFHILIHPMMMSQLYSGHHMEHAMLKYLFCRKYESLLFCYMCAFYVDM